MTRIINITYKTFFPEPDELIEQIQGDNKNYKYEYIPSVLFNEKIRGKEGLLTNTKLFEKGTIKGYALYEAGTSFAQMKKYFKDDFNKNDLILAKKAFQKLRSLANPFSERVIADYCSQIILNSLKNQSQEDEAIFFIEKLSSDKMLGRLGYLYLNLKRVIICFLSVHPDDLMTTVMSRTTGKLYFDIFRLISSKSLHEKFGPYPGCSEDALEQTYFYGSLGDILAKRPSPIRFDIFSQGLSEREIEDKSETVREILMDANETLLYEINDAYSVKLPYGFTEAKKAWKADTYKKGAIRNIINENESKFID